jgi:hypothetical protein
MMKLWYLVIIKIKLVRALVRAYWLQDLITS